MAMADDPNRAFIKDTKRVVIKVGVLHFLFQSMYGLMDLESQGALENVWNITIEKKW